MSAFVACLFVSASPCASGTPLIEFRIAVEYPHDAGAFTQGLVIDRSALYESTGLRGRSSLRKVQLTTGRVVRKRRLSDRLFGEGLALVGDELYQLTWTSGRAFVLRLKDFSLVRGASLRRGGLGSRLRRRAAGDERRQRDASVSGPDYLPGRA